MLDPLTVALLSATIEYGGILSIMCVGLTMTYQTTKVPNFAFADFAVVGMNATYFSYVLLKLSSPYMSVPFSILAGGVFGVLVYVLVMKPLIKKGASILLLMIASLAVDILYTGIQSDIVTIGFAPFSAAFIHAGFPTLVQAAPLPDFSIFGQSGLLVVSPVMLALCTALMFLLLKRSKFGIAMRAAIENPSLARIVGINVERVYLISWFIAGGLGGLAGCLYAVGDGMSLGIQSILILDIFAGSVVGGLSSIYGAAIGGMLVALGEDYVLGVLANSVNSQFSLLAVGGVSMIILIIALLVAPKGLVAVNWKRFFPKNG